MAPQLTVRDVPDEVVERFRQEASERGTSMNSVVRAALLAYVDTLDWQRRVPEEVEAMDALRQRIRDRLGHDLDDSTELIRADRNR